MTVGTQHKVWYPTWPHLQFVCQTILRVGDHCTVPTRKSMPCSTVTIYNLPTGACLEASASGGMAATCMSLVSTCGYGEDNCKLLTLFVLC